MFDNLAGPSSSTTTSTITPTTILIPQGEDQLNEEEANDTEPVPVTSGNMFIGITNDDDDEDEEQEDSELTRKKRKRKD